MVALIARPVFSVYSTAVRLMTGSTPGMPRQIGHTWVFGGEPAYSVGQPQNILLRVASWTWHSRPMTASYLRASAGAGRVSVVAVMEDFPGWAPPRGDGRRVLRSPMLRRKFAEGDTRSGTGVSPEGSPSEGRGSPSGGPQGGAGRVLRSPTLRRKFAEGDFCAADTVLETKFCPKGSPTDGRGFLS